MSLLLTFDDQIQTCTVKKKHWVIFLTQLLGHLGYTHWVTYFVKIVLAV